MKKYISKNHQKHNTLIWSHMISYEETCLTSYENKIASYETKIASYEIA